MTEINQTSVPTEGESDPSKSQFSLLTILLLSAAVATSFSAWQSASKLSRIESQLVSLRAVACELNIDDPSKFAAVKKPPVRHREHTWDVYLPPQDSVADPYEICLAIENFASIYGAIVKNSFPTAPNKTFALKSGRHRINLKHLVDKQTGHAVIVSLKDQDVINITRPYEWQTDLSQSNRSQRLVGQQDTEEPLILNHSVFNVPVPGSPTASISPNDPANGIRLWIRKR